MSEPGLDDDENMPEAPVPVAAQSMNRRQSTTSKSDDDYVGSPFFMSCCMKRGDPVREQFIKLASWKWFDRFILFIIMVNCVTMALDSQPMQVSDGKGGMTSIPEILVMEEIYFWVFNVEFIIKVCALGFAVGEKTYLKDPFNILDFVVVVGAAVDKVLSLSGASLGFSVKPIRALRLLRPLKAVKAIPGMGVVIGAFQRMVPDLTSVFSFLTFVMLLFAILAINMHPCVLRHRCWDFAANECYGGDCTDTTYICGNKAPTGRGWSQCGPRICGGVELMPWEGLAGANAYQQALIAVNMTEDKYDPVTDKWEGCNVQCSDAVADNGFELGTKAVGNADIERPPPLLTYGANPNYGITHFDNLFSAFLTIFQCITLEGWTDVMYMMQDAVGWWATLFNVLVILVGSLVVLSLLLAVIEGSYSQEKDEQDAIEEEELREEKRAIKEQREHDADEEAVRAAVASSPSKVNPEVGVAAAAEDGEEMNLDSSEDMYHPLFPYLFPPLGKIVDGENPSGGPFANFIMICIVANAGTMCLTVDPRTEMAYDLRGFLFAINLTFNIIFILEMVLKWIGLGCNNYWSDGMNYFDFVIVALSIFNMSTDPELFPETTGNGIPGATALRALRAFRVLKLVRSIESFRSILAVLVSSFQNIINVAVLLMLVMFIFALIGMSFFGGQLSTITGEGLPRSHFDTFGFAFGTIFQILTGENWNEVMYNCMGISAVQAVNQQIGDKSNLDAMTAAIYFVLVNFVGNMVMLNLFLAVLLGSFAGADKPGLLAIKLTTTPEEEKELQDAKYGMAEWRDVGRTAAKEDFDLDQEQQQALFIYEDGKPQPAKLWMLYGLPSDYKTDPDTGEYDFDGDETRVITHLQLRVVPDGGQDDLEKMLEEEEEGYEIVVPNVGQLAPHPDCGKDELDAGKTLCLLAGREENVAPIDALVIALGPNTLAGKAKVDAAKEAVDVLEFAGLKDEEGSDKSGDEKPFTVVKVDKFSADTEAEIKKYQDDEKRGPSRPKSGSGPGCGASPLMRPDVTKLDDPAATSIDHAYLYSANTAGARKRLEPTISFYNNKPFHNVSIVVREAEELLFKTADMGSGASGNQVSPDLKANGDSECEAVALPQRMVPRPLTGRQLYDDKGKSCCFMAPQFCLRSHATKLYENPKFDNFVLCCIIVGTICLAIDAPIYNEIANMDSVKTQTLVLSWIDLILTIIFNVEFLTKHIALGVFFGPNAYWQDMWNILDGVIVIIANISLQFNPILSSGSGGGDSSLKSLKALRALRALRPLRTVSRIPSLKVIVKAILGSVPAVSVAFAINLLFMFIFAIMGTQMFAGKMDYCECTFHPVPSTHPDYPVSEDSFPCNSWHVRPSVFPYAKHMGYFDSAGADGKGYAPGSPELQVAPIGLLKISNDGVRLNRQHCVGFTVAPHSVLENIEVGPATYNTVEPPMGADGTLYNGNHTFETRWVTKANGLAYNCDDVISCLQCLFEVSTLEGWLDVMYSGMDNNQGPNIQPERNDLDVWTYIVFWFFIIFIITASFLFVNLFVGVIIDSFNDIKSQEDGSIFLTGPQADWLASQDLVANTAAPMKAMKSPRAIGGTSKMTSMRQYCYEMWWDVEKNDTNPGPDNFIMFIIFLNTVTMAMDHCNMAQEMKDVLDVLALVYNVIYTLEMLTKIMAFYFVQYWTMSNWNKFDSTIVIASWLGVVINEAQRASGSSGSSVTSLITLLRVARVARVFKVLKSAKTVRAMIGTLIMSVPALINVCMLLMLFMFIFAALGMNLFNGVKFGDNLNRYANFNSLGASLSLMFRFSTGEYWNGVQHDLAITPAHHPDDPCMDRNAEGAVFGNYCGNTTMGGIFFTLYTLVLQIILMNLFIAVILEKFSENDPKNLNKLTPDQIEEFANVWVRGDPNGTGIQNAAGLSEIVKKLNHQWYFPLIRKAGIGTQAGTEITYSNTKYGKFDKNIEGMTDVIVETQYIGGKWVVHWNGKNAQVNMMKPEPPRDGRTVAHTVTEVSPNIVTLLTDEVEDPPQYFRFENPPLSGSQGGCCGGTAAPVKDEKLITGQVEPTEQANFPSRSLTSNECLQIANLLKVKGDPESTKRQEIQFGAVLIALCECTKGYAIPDYVNDRCAQVQRTALTLDKQFGGGSGIDMGDVGAAVMVQKVFKGRKYRKNCVFKLSVKDAGKQVKIVFAGTDRTGPTTTRKWTSPPQEPRVSFEGQEYPVQWLEALPKNNEDAGGKTLTVRRAEEGQDAAVGSVEYEGKIYTANWLGAPSTKYEPQVFKVEIDQDHIKRARAATLAPKGTKNRVIGGRIQRIVTLECGAKMVMPLNSSSTTGPHDFADIEMTNKSSPHGDDFAHVNGVVTLADGSQFKNPCKIAVV